jgi:hypothetical protein
MRININMGGMKLADIPNARKKAALQDVRNACACRSKPISMPFVSYESASLQRGRLALLSAPK